MVTGCGAADPLWCAVDFSLINDAWLFYFYIKLIPFLFLYWSVIVRLTFNYEPVIPLSFPRPF